MLSAIPKGAPVASQSQQPFEPPNLVIASLPYVVAGAAGGYIISGKKGALIGGILAAGLLYGYMRLPRSKVF